MFNQMPDFSLANVANLPQPRFFDQNATLGQIFQNQRVAADTSRQLIANQQAQAKFPLDQQTSLADLETKQLQNQQYANMMPLDTEKAQLSNQQQLLSNMQNQQMSPLLLQGKNLDNQTAQQGLQKGKVDLASSLQSYLYPAMSSILSHNNPDEQKAAYDNMYQSVSRMGLDPSSIGLTPTFDKDSKEAMGNYVDFQKSNILSKLVGSGTSIIKDPLTGKPKEVLKYQAIGQQPAQPGGNDKTALSQASLAYGLSAMPQIRAYFAPNGVPLQGSQFAASLAFPRSEGRQVRGAISQIIDGLGELSPRYINNPDKGRAALEHLYLPMAGDSTDEVNEKLNRLEGVARGTFQNVGGDMSSLASTAGKDVQTQADLTSPDNVEKFKRSNPFFKDYPEEIVKSIMIDKNSQSANSLQKFIQQQQVSEDAKGPQQSIPVVKNVISNIIKNHSNSNIILNRAKQSLGNNTSAENQIKQLFLARAESVAKQNISPSLKKSLFDQYLTEAKQAYGDLNNGNA